MENPEKHTQKDLSAEWEKFDHQISCFIENSKKFFKGIFS